MIQKVQILLKSPQCTNSPRKASLNKTQVPTLKGYIYSPFNHFCFAMKKFFLIFSLFFLIACEAEEEMTDAAPRLSSYTVNDQLSFGSLIAERTNQLSFYASDDIGLKNYRLEVRDKACEVLVHIQTKPCQGRGSTIQDSFVIPSSLSARDYQLKLSLSDSKGAVSSLSKEFHLVVGPPSMSIRTDRSQYVPGNRVQFVGSVSDGEDLESLLIFIHRDEFVFDGLDTIGEVIYREFNGSNDTYYNLASTNKHIDLPNSMIIDTYKVVYILKDSDGNGRYFTGPIGISF